MEFPIQSWKYHIAFAFFKFAVIIQGVGVRAVRGQASDVNAGSTPSAFIGALEKSANLAWNYLQENKGSKL